MKLQISLSTADVKFKKGDRVVCKVDKNEWYLGTVARGGSKIKVHFDDGNEADVGAEDFGDVKIVAPDTKPRKKFLTNAQAMQLYRVKPTAKKATVKKSPLAKFSSAKIEGEDVLYKQYDSSRLRGTTLNDYLEGSKVSAKWVTDLTKRVAKEQPPVLYRLCVVSDNAHVGSNVNVSKKIVSASDQKIHAIYAGCSFHHDEGTKLEGKQLAVIEIHGATTCLAFPEILSAVKQNNFYCIERTEKEREYIVKGPISGKVVELVSTSMITSKGYRELVKGWSGSKPLAKKK